VELQGGEVHFILSPKELVEMVGLQNLFVGVRHRRMVDLLDETGNEMLNDPALQINFLPHDSGLSDYARAYEWLRWPDLMSYIGKCHLLCLCLIMQSVIMTLNGHYFLSMLQVSIDLTTGVTG